MRLYRTTIGQWAGTQAAARTFKATHGVDFEQIEVPTDKPGLLAFLNAWSVGADHMTTPLPQADQQPAPIAAQLDDEAFEALPLAYQLHLAALALENARSRIKP